MDLKFRFGVAADLTTAINSLTFGVKMTAAAVRTAAPDIPASV